MDSQQERDVKLRCSELKNSQISSFQYGFPDSEDEGDIQTARGRYFGGLHKRPGNAFCVVISLCSIF